MFIVKLFSFSVGIANFTKTIKIVFVKLNTAEIKYTVKNLKRILEKFYLGIYLKQRLYM